MIIAAAWLIRRARQRTDQPATSTTPHLVVLALVAQLLSHLRIQRGLPHILRQLPD